MSEPPALAGGTQLNVDSSSINTQTSELATSTPPAYAGGSDKATDKKKLRVEQTALAILDARLKFPDPTLADLYDPLPMPKELLDAHRANDEAVDACYGTKRFKNELERLEFLFDLYRQYTEPLARLRETKRKRVI